MTRLPTWIKEDNNKMSNNDSLLHKEEKNFLMSCVLATVFHRVLVQLQNCNKTWFCFSMFLNADIFLVLYNTEQNKLRLFI